MSWTFLLLLSLMPFIASSQPREHTATRTTEVPKIDGDLDDAAWQKTSPATGFTTIWPAPGNPSKHSSEVRILYDNDALYIGAKMFDSAPDSILRELGTRDAGENNADIFRIAFDTYKDGFNAFVFAVSASNVQTDSRINGDMEDESWDAVWSSAVQITETGWNVEISIPYSALRFPKGGNGKWGVNFIRIIRRLRETSAWNFIDPNINGTVNQFGVLNGLQNIEPPIRLSLMPYVGVYAEHFPYNVAGQSNYTTAIRGGMDLKYGLSESFTLDLTLVPDFGQVRSDQVVLNLTPFEIQYSDNRPFFTEGVDIFTKGNLFYSRRIGYVPDQFLDIEDKLKGGETIVKNPGEAQLINAMKISGRTRSGLGIGVFNALAAPVMATVVSEEGIERKFETQPLTNYNVLVFDQSLKNNSSISWVNTNTWREGLNEDAHVTGIFYNLKNKSNNYSISGSGVMSMNQLNTSDFSQTNEGFKYNIRLARISGKIRYHISQWVEDHSYDPNDLGFLLANNNFNHNGGISYNLYKKFWKINVFTAFLGTNLSHQYAPRKFQSFGLNGDFFCLFTSFLAIGGDISISPVDGFDFNEPRVKGYFLRLPPARKFNIWISDDYRKRIAFDIWGGIYQKPEWDNFEWWIGAGPRLRFNDHLFGLPIFNLTISNNEKGAVDVLNGIPLIGNRDITTISNYFELNYIFTSRMGLFMTARHYWSEVDYNKVHELQTDGYLLDRNDIDPDAYDINFSVFTLDLGFQWEFLPGSMMSIVWKNNVDQFSALTGVGYWENFNSTWDAGQRNTFSLRLVYYLDPTTGFKNPPIVKYNW